jgi:membrane-bound ClpP family serine protease
MITNKVKIKKESKFEALFLPVIVGIALLGSMTFLVVSNVRITQQRSAMNDQIEDLQGQIAALEEIKAQYERGLISAEEAAYWEERLREQGYKKPGEEAVVVLPEDEEEQTVADNQGLWDKIKGFLGF